MYIYFFENKKVNYIKDDYYNNGNIYYDLRNLKKEMKMWCNRLSNIITIIIKSWFIYLFSFKYNAYMLSCENNYVLAYHLNA